MAAAKKYVVSIYSPLGGQGASFIASQLVHQLAKTNTCCLVDLNLDYSASIHYLSLNPADAFRKSALSGGEETLLSSFAIKVENNYFAVGAPLLGYGQFAEETHEAAKELVDQCRAEFDFTIIDLPRPLHVELTKSLLKMSDLVLVLGESSDYSAQACIKLKDIVSDKSFAIDLKKLLFLFNKSMTQDTSSWMMFIWQLLALAVVLIAVYFLRPQWFSNPVFFIVGLIILMRLAWPKARDLSKSALTSLAKNQISFFHYLPHDSKACRMAINQGHFLDDSTKIGRSLKELADKLKAKLSALPS
jgi:MinD-like ATPase involved in chromosome partitioning or flagellar assembly